MKHFILMLTVLVSLLGEQAVCQDALGRGNALDRKNSANTQPAGNSALPTGTRNFEMKRNSLLEGQNFNAGIGRADDASMRLITSASNDGDDASYADAINNSPWYWNNWNNQSAQFLIQGDNSYFNPNFIDNWSTSPSQMHSGRNIRSYSHAWDAGSARKFGGTGELEYPSDWSTLQIEQYRLSKVLGSGFQTRSTDTSSVTVGNYANVNTSGYLSASPLSGVSLETINKPYTALGFSAWDAARVAQDEDGGIGSTSLIQVWQTQESSLTITVTDNRVAVPDQYKTVLETIAARARERMEASSAPLSPDRLDEQYAVLQNQLAGTLPAFGEEEDDTQTTSVEVEEEVASVIGSSLRHGEQISHFVTTNQTRFDELVGLGEVALTRREYFLAQKRFNQALRFIPGHPMATVGLGHANIGAGLYLSGGNVLQSLLSFQPEMIDVTYDSLLLPPRLELVRAAIAVKNRIEQDRDGGTYAFLLAYIGHQLQDKEMIEKGLEVLQNRAGNNDPFVMLLRSIWVEEDVTIDSPASQNE